MLLEDAKYGNDETMWISLVDAYNVYIDEVKIPQYPLCEEIAAPGMPAPHQFLPT